MSSSTANTSGSAQYNTNFPSATPYSQTMPTNSSAANRNRSSGHQNVQAAYKQATSTAYGSFGLGANTMQGGSAIATSIMQSQS
jgi:hypothetical protein